MSLHTTIRATWPDGLQMMFGTSYRTWHDQLSEYCVRYKLAKPSIEVSETKWIFGKKWCSWDNFQRDLTEEGQGRTVDQFEFRLPNEREARCLAMEFKQ